LHDWLHFARLTPGILMPSLSVWAPYSPPVHLSFYHYVAVNGCEVQIVRHCEIYHVYVYVF
jgi:hypothetical protein